MSESKKILNLLRENNTMLKKLTKKLDTTSRDLKNSPNYDGYLELSECIEPSKLHFMTSTDVIKTIEFEMGENPFGFKMTPRVVGRVLSHFFGKFRSVEVRGGISVKGYAIKLRDF